MLLKCYYSLSMVEHALGLDLGGEDSPQLWSPTFSEFGTWKKMLAGEIIMSEGGPVLNEASVRPENTSSCQKLSMKVLVLGRSINFPPNAKDKSLLLFWPPVLGEGWQSKAV